MKEHREQVRLGGLELNPFADLALPLLLALSAAMSVALVGGAVRDWWGLRVVALLPLWAFLFAMESYLFTLIFEVREVDLPAALRWVEMAVMAALALLLGALPVAGGLVAAVTGGWAQAESYVGAVLLAYAWYQGMRSARLIAPLHPDSVDETPGQERLANDDHAQAFDAIRTQVFAVVAGLAVVLGAGNWWLGEVRIWGWSWYGAGLLVLALLGAGAVLVAARLKMAMTWRVERVSAVPAVFGQWMARGLSLLLVPFVVALLLPAGPRVPVERLLGLLPEQGPVRDLRELQPPLPSEGKSEGPNLTEVLDREIKPWFEWPTVPSWVWYGLGALAVLWLLYRAARQLADRSGQLKGAWAVLGAVARWYVSLFKAAQEMLVAVLKQAVVTPVETLTAAVFGEAGALGRYLPFRGRAPGEPRAALRYYFARLQAEAGRRGIRRGAGGTAAEFGQRLAEAAPEQASEISRLTVAYETARYSGQPVDAETVTFARRTWAVIIRALRRR
jgi:hypothetical protein